MRAHRPQPNRSFGLGLAIFALLAGFWPLLRGDGPRYWAIAAGIAILGVAVFAPKLLAIPTRLWTRFSDRLGRVMGAIVLAGLFYVVLTPFALLVRLARRDPLRLRFDKGTKTYWIERDPPGPVPNSMKQQF
jgi:multisubunit Na+/H+ antiporter MnhG subunit